MQTVPTTYFLFLDLDHRLGKIYLLFALNLTVASLNDVISVFLFLIFSTGRIPFAFLEDIHQRFVRTYGRAVLSAQAYAMNDEFSRVMSQQMEYYSSDPNADRINRLKGEMSQVSVWSWLIRCKN